MNISQRILTGVFLVLFVLGSIIGVAQEHVYGDGEHDFQRQAAALAEVWIFLGVLYAGLFFILAPRRRP